VFQDKTNFKFTLRTIK